MTEIQNAGERAASLTQQLLAFSRKQIIRPVLLDLNAVVQDVEKMLHRLIGENIELILHLESNLWRVKADPGQIQQVLVNLAVNARDAMPRGGRLTLETSNRQWKEKWLGSSPELTHGAYVILTVGDTGVGMNEEAKRHLFEPFFTTKSPGQGTGLGLSTVYGIVTQSGGAIDVYSESGEGTLFKIYLPRAKEDETAIPIPVPVVTAMHGTETILLVEDQDDLRRLITEVLRGYGYKVFGAGSAEEAMRVSSQCPEDIHLMITDVVMPGMSGPELALHLKPLRPAMKTVFMSGYTQNVIIDYGVLELGNFLSKPFTPAMLTGKVREVLGALTP